MMIYHDQSVLLGFATVGCLEKVNQTYDLPNGGEFFILMNPMVNRIRKINHLKQIQASLGEKPMQLDREA